MLSYINLEQTALAEQLDPHSPTHPPGTKNSSEDILWKPAVLYFWH